MSILRETGPQALTSVNVASRIGVTQSAIYRHIDNMDQLIAIASSQVVDEVTAVMLAAVATPETMRGDGTRFTNVAERVGDLIAQHPQSFSVIDRWRLDDSLLGDGIRLVLRDGRELIAAELEAEWRTDFDIHEPFDDATKIAQLAHAGLLINDVIGVARFTQIVQHNGRHSLARLLEMRLFACWCAYVLDINHRVQVPVPHLDDPHFTPPEFALA